MLGTVNIVEKDLNIHRMAGTDSTVYLEPPPLLLQITTSIAESIINKSSSVSIPTLMKRSLATVLSLYLLSTDRPRIILPVCDIQYATCSESSMGLQREV